MGKGYSTRNLKNMRKFFIFQKGQALPTQLTWSHYCELLKLDNKDEIDYYVEISIDQNLSYRQLHERIKNNEYRRLPNNTKLKRINKQNIKIEDSIKNPIIIKNKYDTDAITEKMLQQLILEDISSFMKELGAGYSFIDNEYKIRVGKKFNFIDLLLFNIEFNCYVVVELKVTEMRKEYLGQIEVYMNYIDKNIKNVYQNNTIGIIIVKKENKFVIEYASDNRIHERRYILN